MTAGVCFLVFMLFSDVFVPEVWTELTLLMGLEKKCSGKSWLPTQRLKAEWWW